MLPDADKTDTRTEDEIGTGEIFRHYISRRDWSHAAELCKDGDWLTLTGEEALMLGAFLPTTLRMDSDGSGGWIVSKEAA